MKEKEEKKNFPYSLPASQLMAMVMPCFFSLFAFYYPPRNCFCFFKTLVETETENKLPKKEELH